MSAKTNLPDRLLRYSATASLVTAGLLATVPQSTMAGTTITNDWGPTGTTLSTDTPFLFDVDGFGDNDMAIVARTSTITNIALGAIGTETFSFIGNTGAVGAVALPYVVSYGAAISSLTGPWVARGSAGNLLTSYSGAIAPHWSSQDGTEKNYVGFRIVDDDANNIRYGWIELEVTAAAQGGPQVILYRTAIDSPAGSGLPADVTLTEVSVAGGMQTLAASALAALGGALTWLRRKLRA